MTTRFGKYPMNQSPALSPSRREAVKALGAFAALTTALPVGAAFAQSGSLHAVTYLDTSAASTGRGIELLAQLRDTARKNSANLEFTILQEMGRPNRFAFFESWANDAAFEAFATSESRAAFDEALKSVRNSPPDRKMLRSHVVASPRAVPPGAIYMVEHLDYFGGSPKITADAEPLSSAMAAMAQKDAGVLRFDLYRGTPPRVNHYQVISVFADAQALEAHENSAHKLQFRVAGAKGATWRCNMYDQRLFKAL